MKRLLSSFFPFILATMLALFSFASHATSVSLTPDADTYIEVGDMDNFFANHGSDATLELSRFSIFSDFAILISFDLSSIPSGATINSATLRLFQGPAPYNPLTDTFDLSLVTSMWSETTVSGSSAPSFGGASSSIAASANPIFDITSFVDDWVNNSVPNYGVFLDNTGFNNSGNFVSREGTGSVPLLDIDYTVVPIPAALPLLLSSLGFIFANRRMG